MIRRIAFYLCVLVLLAACSLESRPSNLVVSASLYEPFTLHIEETARLPDARLDITFVSVPEDGRCPTNINCAATLPVQITLQVEYTGFSVASQLMLSAHTGTDGAVTPGAPGVVPAERYGSHLISLVSMTPYPDAEHRTRSDEYAVTLRVTELAPETPAASTPAPVLGEEFALQLGESAQLQDVDLRLTFEEVVADSRCPADVDCVWSGVVNVRLSAELPDQEAKSFILGGVTDRDGVVVEASGPTASWYVGYTITLKQVTPYPAHANRQAPLEEYRARLVVTRAPASEPTPTAETTVAPTPPFPVDESGLPILCLSERALAQWAAGVATEEPVRLTPPVAAETLVEKGTATALCADQFGDDFHVAETGDMSSTWQEFAPAEGTYWLWDWETGAPVAAPEAEAATLRRAFRPPGGT